MNKIFLTLTAILILTLTACSASTATGQADETAPSQSASLTTEETLLLGTFNLEGTDQAVTADQAADLLPLWQVYADLQTSDTAAQAEIDALLVQIEETMTAGQISAIEAMNLTQQDVFTVMQAQNIGMVQSTSTSSDTTTTSQSSGGMALPDGGGAPPDGGGMPMGDMTGSTNSATTQSDTSAPATNDPTSMLIEALIQLLQGKIAS